MQQLLLCLLLPAMLGLTTQVAAQDSTRWAPTASSEERDSFFDLETIREVRPGVFSAWRWDKLHAPLNNPTFGRYDSVKHYALYDCNEESTMHLTGVYYLGERRVNEHTLSEAAREWDVQVPETVGELWLRAVCMLGTDAANRRKQ